MNAKQLKKMMSNAAAVTAEAIETAHMNAIDHNRSLMTADEAHEAAIEYNYSLTRISDVETAHALALEIARFMLFTNKEKNAFKRITETKVDMKKSTFCASTKVASQAFRIDEALTEFHTMNELLHLDVLKDCKESRIKSHISFLQHEFKHSCKYVVEDSNARVKRFKFELL